MASKEKTEITPDIRNDPTLKKLIPDAWGIPAKTGEDKEKKKVMKAMAFVLKGTSAFDASVDVVERNQDRIKVQCYRTVMNSDWFITLKQDRVFFFERIPRTPTFPQVWSKTWPIQEMVLTGDSIKPHFDFLKQDLSVSKDKRRDSKKVRAALKEVALQIEKSPNDFKAEIKERFEADLSRVLGGLLRRKNE